MREYIFRGKRTDGDGWVIGRNILHVANEGGVYIVQTGQGLCGMAVDGRSINVMMIPFLEIDPETVGQFTGLTDKNGKKIFEGDIVCEEFCGKKVGVVTFGMGTFDSGIYKYNGWHIRDRHGDVDHNELFIYDDVKLEVIGNIHDNPELLKGE